MADDGDADRPKKGLSSQILSMQFMRRRKEAEERAELEEKHRQHLDDHWTQKDREMSGGLQLETDFVFSRKTGRRSFMKFNPTIEKLYQKQAREERKKGRGRGEEHSSEEEEEEEEDDDDEEKEDKPQISDDQMAALRAEKLNQIMADASKEGGRRLHFMPNKAKSKKKENNNRKRRKF